jgi:hypothetical protein
VERDDGDGSAGESDGEQHKSDKLPHDLSLQRLLNISFAGNKAQRSVR